MDYSVLEKSILFVGIPAKELRDLLRKCRTISSAMIKERSSFI